MRKIFAFLIALALVFGASPAFASKSKDSKKFLTEVAETEGVYDVPGHPELKVRVFIHRENAKPGAASSLVCGLPDSDSAAVVSPEAWRLPESFSFKLNSASVPVAVGKSNLLEMATESFLAWNQAAQNIFVVAYTGETSASRQALDYQNIITWGRTSGSALATTYIWYSPLTGQVVDVDTVMNKKFVWSWWDPDNQTTPDETCAYSNTYDAQNILMHELGHWFGLDDEYTSEYVNNTMYGYGSKMETKKNTLTTGDINGIRALYP